MLDPLSAIGLAGNIVQFLDFSCQLVASTREAYQSADGLKNEHAHIQYITTKLTESVQAVRTRQQKPTSGLAPFSNAANSPLWQRFGLGDPLIAENALCELAEDCEREATALLLCMDKLKIKDSNGKKWTSFKKALLAVWHADDIEKLEARLSQYRAQLNLNLGVLIFERQSGTLNALRTLVMETETATEDNKADFHRVHRGIVSIKQEVGMSKDELNDRVNSLSTQISQWMARLSDEARMCKIRDVLSSLNFTKMEHRADKIPEAHNGTFQWIFERSTECTASRPNCWFIDWLEGSEHEENIYWIAGKAGSGKSTLMKFIKDHPVTMGSLKYWAGSRRLVPSTYFFWNAGTDLQKSQPGLLRTLLYTILRQCPESLPAAFPDFWERSASTNWKQKELLDGLFALKNELSSSVCYCFFIDGLDEYEGDPRDLLQVLRELSKSANIKVCLSSRPYNIFTQAFDQFTKRRIYLQESTRQDIVVYVRDKLAASPEFQEVRTEDAQYDKLVEELVDRARGVFLWVYLVVRSLLDGLTNADSIQTLRGRLQEIPTDLGLLYQHILDSVDKVYQVQMSRTFDVANAVNGPSPLLLYAVVDEIEENPQFGMVLATGACLFHPNAPVSPIHRAGICDSSPSIAVMERNMRKRLNARTKGLLEVSADDGRVNFLHQTVRDFLAIKNRQGLSDGVAKTLFNPHFLICQAIVGVLRLRETLPPLGSGFGTLTYFETIFGEQAKCVQCVFKDPLLTALEELSIEELEPEWQVSKVSSRHKIGVCTNDVCAPDIGGLWIDQDRFFDVVLEFAFVRAGKLEPMVIASKFVENPHPFAEIETPARSESKLNSKLTQLLRGATSTLQTLEDSPGTLIYGNQPRSPTGYSTPPSATESFTTGSSRFSLGLQNLDSTVNHSVTHPTKSIAVRSNRTDNRSTARTYPNAHENDPLRSSTGSDYDRAAAGYKEVQDELRKTSRFELEPARRRKRLYGKYSSKFNDESDDESDEEWGVDAENSSGDTFSPVDRSVSESEPSAPQLLLPVEGSGAKLMVGPLAYPTEQNEEIGSESEEDESRDSVRPLSLESHSNGVEYRAPMSMASALKAPSRIIYFSEGYTHAKRILDEHNTPVPELVREALEQRLSNRTTDRSDLDLLQSVLDESHRQQWRTINVLTPLGRGFGNVEINCLFVDIASRTGECLSVASQSRRLLLVKLLLYWGAKPNAKCGKQTPWTAYLDALYGLRGRLSLSHLNTCYEEVQLFLQYDAFAKAIARGMSVDCVVRAVFTEEHSMKLHRILALKQNEGAPRRWIGETPD